MRIKRLLILVGLLFLTACNQPEKTEPVAEEILIDSIDLYPKYPGCEDFYEQNKQLDCLIDKMNNFVDYLIEKKYPKEFASITDTLWVEFVIDTTGITHQAGILYKDSINKQVYENIFNDIARKIPKIKPAIYQDKPVNFVYKIPIINLKDSLPESNITN